ncbi:MAG: glycerate kinase [Saccharofermentans sp.]|nr:glycerate kinase [Saccharofermentans sp.]
MKIVAAMDSFKGSLTSLEAGNAAAEGVRECMPEADVSVCPLADGGEGTVDAVYSAVGGEYITKNVTGPSGKKVEARYLIFDDIAVIEIASAAGITLIGDEENDIIHATTYGVGELISDALSRGIREFYIGLGGSATNDCGIGMLKALGYRFTDSGGRDADLGSVERIEMQCAMPELKKCSFKVLSDVNNPLYGPNGASAVFAPQKGASPEEVALMDEWMKRFAALVSVSIPGTDSDLPGNGAAGGLGFAFRTFLGADIRSGADTIIEMSGLEDKIERSDIVITGEGKIDRQTMMGKGPSKIAEIAKKHGKKVIAFGGTVEDCDYSSLFNDVCQIEKTDGENHMDNAVAYRNLRQSVKYRFSSIN